MPLTDEQLLVEVEDILLTNISAGSVASAPWSRALWNMPKTIILRPAVDQFHGQNARDAQEGFRKIITILHEARHNLRVRTMRAA